MATFVFSCNVIAILNCKICRLFFYLRLQLITALVTLTVATACALGLNLTHMLSDVAACNIVACSVDSRIGSRVAL